MSMVRSISFEFKAIGTHWSIESDGESIGPDLQEHIRKQVGVFEQRFSRFLPDSEVNALRNAPGGLYPISQELGILLSRADELRLLTGGVYDPVVGMLLEMAGYNAAYDFSPQDGIDSLPLPKWELRGTAVHIDGPVAFDLGGMGKGYCIDMVALMLQEYGIKHFIIDAGGDIFATSKESGEPWRVAIQYPGRPDTAAGMALLHHQAIAVSDSFRRRWGKWHHIMNVQTRTSVESIIGAAAVAHTAWDADCMTSVLFLGTPHSYREAAERFDAQYLVFHADGTCLKSQNWSGELF